MMQHPGETEYNSSGKDANAHGEFPLETVVNEGMWAGSLNFTEDCSIES